MLTALAQKFTLQSTYTSPNDNRWILTDHFYVHSIESGGVSIDIFNVDTNDADVHGAAQICCQCYGYAGDDDKTCNNVARGDAACAGGSTDMYDQCVAQLKTWGDDSRSKLASYVKNSTADWKIVNSHYGPYDHYAEANAATWRKLLQGLGVQVFLYGHTHGEKHDYSTDKIHFVENGAGGGIQSESASSVPTYAQDYVSNVWTATGYPYGFFELNASKNWIKLRFLTFDDQWQMAKTVAASTIGGIKVGHCWYIPNDGSKGQACSS